MKTIVSALMISLSLVAGAAQAAHVDAPSTKTRAQVIAELQEASAQGLLSRGEGDYPLALKTSNSKTRQDVRAELADARMAGTLSRGEGDYPPETPSDSSKTGAEVQAELVAYNAEGHGPIPN